MKKEKSDRILAIIASIVEELNTDEIDFNTDLEQMGMDSIAFIRIIVTLEDEFEIEFPDEYLLISRMNTINKITDIVLTLEAN